MTGVRFDGRRGKGGLPAPGSGALVVRARRRVDGSCRRIATRRAARTSRGEKGDDDDCTNRMDKPLDALRRRARIVALRFHVVGPRSGGRVLAVPTRRVLFLFPSAGPIPRSARRTSRRALLTNATVQVETSAGSHAFSTVGTLPSADISSFWRRLRACFTERVEDCGRQQRWRIVHQLPGRRLPPSLSGTWFSANHFDGEWIDERYVALTTGTFGSPSIVTALDSTSPLPGSPSNTVLVGNIGGASAGIAFDAAVTLMQWLRQHRTERNWCGACHVASRVAGRVGGRCGRELRRGCRSSDILSASPLAFDGERNLLVGGGDGGSDVNCRRRPSLRGGQRHGRAADRLTPEMPPMSAGSTQIPRATSIRWARIRPAARFTSPILARRRCTSTKVRRPPRPRCPHGALAALAMALVGARRRR